MTPKERAEQWFTQAPQYRTKEQLRMWFEAARAEAMEEACKATCFSCAHGNVPSVGIDYPDGKSRLMVSHRPFKCESTEPCADCMALINDVPTCGHCNADYYCAKHVGPAIAAMNFKPVPVTEQPSGATHSEGTRQHP